MPAASGRGREDSWSCRVDCSMGDMKGWQKPGEAEVCETVLREGAKSAFLLEDARVYCDALGL